MNILGLSKDSRIQQYLQSTYRLESFEFEGLPAFKKDDTYFLGGFKGFYAVLIDEDEESVTKIMKSFFAKHPKVVCDFSVSGQEMKGSLIHYLLRLDKGFSVEKRFDLYNKKTRNQVRKSYLNDLRIEVGVPPQGFYDLYVANMKRLKSIAKDRSYFENLERFLGESVLCFSLFDGDTLVGGNYAIVSQNYLTIMFNTSNSQYWGLNINDRLYDELIVWAIEHGIEFVDFGPGVYGDASHNHFKEGFGASRRTIISTMQMNFLNRVQFFLLEKKRNIRLRLIKLMK